MLLRIPFRTGNQPATPPLLIHFPERWNELHGRCWHV